MSKLRGKEDQIIKMYKGGSRVLEIATKYGVVDTTIHRLLHKQKVPVTRCNYRPRRSNYNMKKRVFSQELIAKMKENTRVNDKYIKYVKFENTTGDQILVTNILSRPVIG